MYRYPVPGCLLEERRDPVPFLLYSAATWLALRWCGWPEPVGDGGVLVVQPPSGDAEWGRPWERRYCKRHPGPWDISLTSRTSPAGTCGPGWRKLAAGRVEWAIMGPGHEYVGSRRGTWCMKPVRLIPAQAVIGRLDFTIAFIVQLNVEIAGH